MKKIILKIEGMTCSACSQGLEKYLNRQEVIKEASVNLVMATASIICEDNIMLEELAKFVEEAGFESKGEYKLEENEKQTNGKKILILNGLLAVLVLYISMSHMIGLPVIPYLDIMKNSENYAMCLMLFSIYFLFVGKNIIKNGIKNIKHKSPNMDTLVTIGVLSSFFYSIYNTINIFMGYTNYVEYLYFESVCIILYLIKLGRYIDNISKEQTKEAIKDLVTITPQTALIKIKDKEKEITLDEIKKNDILIVKPGMKYAVDGTIINGSSHIDESFISGESLPIKKKIGDKVVAGSVNIDGFVEYKAEKIGAESTISEIVRLVVEATNTKTPIERIADKISGIFVPSILLIALLTLVGYLIFAQDINEALISAVTVLVCACPCALGLATPLAIVVSEGISAKNGILIKKSETLEEASKVDTIVFDKTGTLTYGKLKVAKINNYSKYSDDELIRIVSSIEKNTSHPISLAFTNYSNEKNQKLLEVNNFKNIEGIGITGKIKDKEYHIGNSKILEKIKIKNEHLEDENKLTKQANSIIYVIENKEVIGLIGVCDIVRTNTKEIIKNLKSMKKEIIMLTGDNERTAKIIAESIGIKNVIANVLPKEKSDIIKNLKKNGNKVMMIGDGINDAPSISIADIGVSLYSATDVAGNSADVILMNNNLKSITNLFDISKKTIKIIKQNLFWAFFYNICMIPAAIGLLKFANIEMNPMLAGLAMTISSLTVVFNSLRLKRWKEK